MKCGTVKPDVLIISSNTRVMHHDDAAYYSSLGSGIVRIDFNIQNKRLHIQSFNDAGIKYASIKCEVSDEIKAWDMVRQYLGSSQKFDLIISLDTSFDQNSHLLRNFLKTGGSIYTQDSTVRLYH